MLVKVWNSHEMKEGLCQSNILDKIFVSCIRLNSEQSLKNHFIHANQSNPLNMINYAQSISIINELFYIMSAILIGKRKCDIRNFQDQKKFESLVQIPYFDMLFDQEIDNLLDQNYFGNENVNNILINKRLGLGLSINFVSNSVI